jgi:hypothetical protein
VGSDVLRNVVARRPRSHNTKDDAFIAPIEFCERLEIFSGERGECFVVDFVNHHVIDGANLHYLHEPPCW